MSITEDATQFNWMLNNFVKDTAGVTDSVAVSSDGLLMAKSNTLDPRAPTRWRRSSRAS